MWRPSERAQPVLTQHKEMIKWALANVTICAVTFRIRDDSDLWVMTRTGQRTAEDRHKECGSGDRDPVHVTDPVRRTN